MLFDDFSAHVTFVCLILSFCVVVVYSIRVLYRNDIDYDGVAEWLAHGTHGLGMMYMSSVMLGIIPHSVPFEWLIFFFMGCALVFVVRLMLKMYKLWWWDVLHVIGSASMSYMFLDTVSWSEIWTTLFMLFYIGNTVLYAYYVRVHMTIKSPRVRVAQQLSNAGHHAMALAMILMLGAMQWPGEMGRLSGTICSSKVSR